MKRILKSCLNWKVIGAVVTAALAIWLFAPHLLASAVPFLFVAVCPLSMLLMMSTMNSGQGSSTTGSDVRQNGAGAPVRVEDLRARLEEVHRQQRVLQEEIDKLESSSGERRLSTP